MKNKQRTGHSPEHFKPVLQDIFAVLSEQDAYGVLENEVIPEGFAESDATRILTSYQAFVDEHGDAGKSSVTEKFSGGKYTTPYEFFHDLKVSASCEIVRYAVGSYDYKLVDKFFTSAAELMLRELSLFGLVLEKKPKDCTGLLTILKGDFEGISKMVSVQNDEALMYINKVEEPVAPSYHTMYSGSPQTKTTIQPLFTGLLGKLSLDPRPTYVPDPYQLTKVVGAPSVLQPSGSIKAFGGQVARIPGPGQGPTQVLDSFFHPNWYTIDAPKWLVYKQRTLRPPIESKLVLDKLSPRLRSTEKFLETVRLFAPSHDLRNSVLSDELKSSVWLNHIGFKRIAEIRRKHSENKLSAALVEPRAAPEVLLATPEPSKETPPVVSAKGKSIKMENLVRFFPERAALVCELEAEKHVAASPVSLQKAISVSLLRLNKLRQERFLRGSSATHKPLAAEAVVYHKVVRLFKVLMKLKAAQDAQVPVGISHSVPFLASEYLGVLPGPSLAKSSSIKPRIGVRGPYKKRNLV